MRFGQPHSLFIYGGDILVAQFFYNKADKKQVGKNAKSGSKWLFLEPKKWNGDTDVNIYYKEDTDLVHPVFTFLPRTRMSNNINYIHVDDVDRWYYVNEITYSQKMLELHCTVDVLTSFADEIKEQYAIVIRQEQNYNLYLTDDKLRTDAQGRVLTYPFSSGFATAYSGGEVKNCSYIFAINGGGDTV